MTATLADWNTDTPNEIESGWCDRNGRIYYCRPWEHRNLSEVLAAPLGWVSLMESFTTDDSSRKYTVDSDEYLIDRGWVRLYGNTDPLIRWASKGSRLTAEQRNAMSRAGYDLDDEDGIL